jgi:hypothetical protein
MCTGNTGSIAKPLIIGFLIGMLFGIAMIYADGGVGGAASIGALPGPEPSPGSND